MPEFRLRQRTQRLLGQIKAVVGNPRIVLPIVGAVSFWAQRDKSFNTGQLIAIGIGVAPWLLRFVKSMELFGQKVDFQNQTPEETKASLENRVLDTQTDSFVATGGETELKVDRKEARAPSKAPSLRLGDFLKSERAALTKLALMYGGHAKADVKLAGIAWDGVIKTSQDYIAVEIKHVSPNQRFSAENLKIELVQMIRSRRSGMADAGVKVPEIAVIIITHGAGAKTGSQIREAAGRVAEMTGASVWVWANTELSYAG